MAAKTAPAKTSASPSASAQEGPPPPSFLAPDLIVRGRLEGQGRVDIGGIVEGDIRVAQTVITPAGRVRATLEATDAVISGNLAGIIKARSVTFTDGCQFKGEIQYESLGCEPNASLEATFVPVVSGDARTYVAGAEAVTHPTLPPAPAVPAAAASTPTAGHAAQDTAANGPGARWRTAAAWLMVMVGAVAGGLLLVSPAAKDWRAGLMDSLRKNEASSSPAPTASGTAPAPQTGPAPAEASQDGAPAATDDPLLPAKKPARPDTAEPASAAPPSAGPNTQTPNAGAEQGTPAKTATPPAPPAATAPASDTAKPAGAEAPTAAPDDAKPAPTPPATAPAKTKAPEPKAEEPPPAPAKAVSGTTSKTEAEGPAKAPAEPAAKESPVAPKPAEDKPEPPQATDTPKATEAPKQDDPQEPPAAPAPPQPRAATPVPAEEDSCVWKLQCDDVTGRCVSVRECKSD